MTLIKLNILPNIFYFQCIFSVFRTIGTIVSYQSRILRFTLIIAAILVLTCCSRHIDTPGYQFQINVGEQFAQNGQYAKAQSVLDKVDRLNAKTSEAQLALANSYFNQKAFIRAAGHYERVRRLGREQEGAFGLARIALAQNNGAAAVKILTPLINARYTPLDYLNSLGVAHDLLSDHKTAQRYYERVLALDPDNIPALNNRALSYALSGNKVESDNQFSALYRSALGSSVVRQNTALVKALNGQSKLSDEMFRYDLKESEVKKNLSIANWLRQVL